MAGWLIPALKAILPHVGDIVSAAKPVFTKRRPEPAAPPPPDLLQQQISELQAAASQNAAHITELAAQLQNTVNAIEKAAALAEARLRRALIFCALSVAVSLVAVGIALAVAVTR